MNEKKIAFIICVNNDEVFMECERYINTLEVPESYEIEIIKVVGARSMASGYNEGMERTDAKYKIYMHQDVFIVRRDFLKRILKVFLNEPKIGLLGVVGSDAFVEDAIYWDKWNLGQLYACSGVSTMLLKSEVPMHGDYMWAVAVDGMLMATQYDVEWREDLFLAWDFYDISQSFEFRRSGYEVAVLSEATTSVSTIHDCGFSKLSSYHQWREVFCKEYEEYGFRCGTIGEDSGARIKELVEQYTSLINQYMKIDLEKARVLALKGHGALPGDNTLMRIKCIFQIYELERQNSSTITFMRIGDKWEDISRKYDYYKYLLRRLEFSTDEEVKKVLYEELVKQKVSTYALEYIVYICCFDICGVEKKLMAIWESISE